MAKLSAMPDQVTVDSFKGVVDFYLYKGQACARSWPQWKRREPWPDERSNQLIFSYAARMWRYLPQAVRDAYNQMAVSVPVTGRDIFIRSYIKGNPGRFVT